MNVAIYALAVIGGFWAACALLLGAACAYGAWSSRRIRARHAVAQWPQADLRQTIREVNDDAFLLAIGVDPTQTASRPYDHEREGL